MHDPIHDFLNASARWLTGDKKAVKKFRRHRDKENKEIERRGSRDPSAYYDDGGNFHLAAGDKKNMLHVQMDRDAQEMYGGVPLYGRGRPYGSALHESSSEMAYAPDLLLRSPRGRRRSRWISPNGRAPFSMPLSPPLITRGETEPIMRPLLQERPSPIVHLDGYERQSEPGLRPGGFFKALEQAVRRPTPYPKAENSHSRPESITPPSPRLPSQGSECSGTSPSESSRPSQKSSLIGSTQHGKQSMNQKSYPDVPHIKESSTAQSQRTIRRRSKSPSGSTGKIPGSRESSPAPPATPEVGSEKDYEPSHYPMDDTASKAATVRGLGEMNRSFVEGMVTRLDLNSTGKAKSKWSLRR
ncbi:hypothetical protein EG329_013565 [Mollisiaceae sp. DMI_Dod_QoI]|nr:hypothetical protein EG329_013565 [Helotiales sp. DMI_Dod_QoI]